MNQENLAKVISIRPEVTPEEDQAFIELAAILEARKLHPSFTGYIAVKCTDMGEYLEREV